MIFVDRCVKMFVFLEAVVIVSIQCLQIIGFYLFGVGIISMVRSELM